MATEVSVARAGGCSAGTRVGEIAVAVSEGDEEEVIWQEGRIHPTIKIRA